MDIAREIGWVSTMGILVILNKERNIFCLANFDYIHEMEK